MTTIDVYVGNGKYITFDQELLNDFIIAYNKAIKEEQISFTFEEIDILIPYANYVIEFVKTQLTN